MTFRVPKFVILAILDGWGIAPQSSGNAITAAKTLNMDKFWHIYPHTLLEASGESVGLPKLEDGNTETGHLNLGAGRIVYQDLQRINMSIADASFFENSVLQGAIEHAKKNRSRLHLMGLLGTGGVHSNSEHLYALLKLAAQSGLKDVFIHVFSDGRDSPMTAVKTYVDQLENVIKKEGVGKIATIMGRYWAMDRDQRWDRTEKAYLALTQGLGNKFKSVQEAVDASYSNGETDEFIKTSIILNENQKPVALIQDNDSVIFFNFRIDRVRQLTKAFVFADFSQAPISFDLQPFLEQFEKPSEASKKESKEPFARGNKLKNLYFVTMTDYGKPITDAGTVAAFPPEIINMPLSGAISSSDLRQLKLTESEKERFVTFYFNGLRDKAYPMEDRIIIPSEKISTYDQKPQMRAYEITEKLLQKLPDSNYSFVLINFPNPDMVGHTGNIGACVKAIEVVDECLGKIANFVLAYQGVLIITADHGNAEEMINDKTGEIDTEHSTNPVPFIAVAQKFMGKSQGLRSGILADVAPTILSLLSLPTPTSMTGKNLLSDVSVI